MSNVVGLTIVGLLAAVMLGALLPTIANNFIGQPTSADINTSRNMTGATGTIMQLVPIFAVIVIIVTLLGAAGLKVKANI